VNVVVLLVVVWFWFYWFWLLMNGVWVVFVSLGLLCGIFGGVGWLWFIWEVVVVGGLKWGEGIFGRWGLVGVCREKTVVSLGCGVVVGGKFDLLLWC